MRFLKNIYHYLLGFFGNLFFGFPSNKIEVIGITGTKGKSTTIAILSWIFEKAGIKTSYLSSVHIKIGDNLKKNKTGNSMPGRFFIPDFLKKSKNAGCKVALIEVTSQGVAQHRHRFINWDKAVFLDIHPEHIDSHGSFEKYLQAKVNFFSSTKKHSSKKPEFFVNKDDKHSKDFIEAGGREKTNLFSKEDIKKYNINQPATIPGDFNKINISASTSLALKENIPLKIIKEAIENFPGVQGRMNFVIKSPFTAIVDYAHTPDSLEEVYKFAAQNKKNNLICVLGSAGGGRDKWKRPEMGKIAEKYCDKIILTNEDPFEEDPKKIIEDIKNGIEKKEVMEILDRKEAIKKAISLAEKDDIIIFTGKGSEDYIREKNGKKIPWSEAEEVKKAFELLEK